MGYARAGAGGRTRPTRAGGAVRHDQREISGVSLLFCDLVGSTALTMEIGEAASDELRHHLFEALRRPIAVYGGREVKSQGDGLMVAFDTLAPESRGVAPWRCSAPFARAPRRRRFHVSLAIRDRGWRGARRRGRTTTSSGRPSSRQHACRADARPGRDRGDRCDGVRIQLERCDRTARQRLAEGVQRDGAVLEDRLGRTGWRRLGRPGGASRPATRRPPGMGGRPRRHRPCAGGVGNG